jgi:hypothetical protein
MDIRPTRTAEVVPSLLCCHGKNIIQHPGTMGQAEARAFRNRLPTVIAPAPARDRFRIRFILDKDGSVLSEWRASNNKTHWQKAVTILESRNLSPKDIATKIERAEGNVEKWIQAFNRFGLEGLKRPDGRKGPAKSRENDRRVASEPTGAAIARAAPFFDGVGGCAAEGRGLRIYLCRNEPRCQRGRMPRARWCALGRLGGDLGSMATVPRTAQDGLGRLGISAGPERLPSQFRSNL